MEAENTATNIAVTVVQPCTGYLQSSLRDFGEPFFVSVPLRLSYDDLALALVKGLQRYTLLDIVTIYQESLKPSPDDALDAAAAKLDGETPHQKETPAVRFLLS
jgi:hypothetical protein